MKRQREKIYVSNPLANATGKQYEKSGKTLTLDTSKLGQAGKLTTPQKPYKPEQCSMYVLPMNYRSFNFSQKGGKTITFNKYVENCLGLRAGSTLPVSEDTAGISSTWMLGLSDDKISMDVVQAAFGFFKAYKRGYIQKIFDEINKHFKNGSWYDEYLKNSYYYTAEDASGFVYSVIDANIFAGDIDITDSSIFDNVKIAILRFIFDQQGFFENGYTNIKKINDNTAKSVRKKIKEFGIEDILSLGITRADKAVSEAYFNAEYKRKITKPNEEIYKKAKEVNDKKKTYKQIVKENSALLTDNPVEERKRWSDATTDKPTLRGAYSENKHQNNENEHQNRKTNSDKTMLLVAVGVLVGIFFLKKKIN